MTINKPTTAGQALNNAIHAVEKAEMEAKRPSRTPMPQSWGVIGQAWAEIAQTMAAGVQPDPDPIKAPNRSDSYVKVQSAFYDVLIGLAARRSDVITGEDVENGRKRDVIVRYNIGLDSWTLTSIDKDPDDIDEEDEGDED